jgi:hypothetical protein
LWLQSTDWRINFHLKMRLKVWNRIKQWTCMKIMAHFRCHKSKEYLIQLFQRWSVVRATSLVVFNNSECFQIYYIKLL